MKFGRKRKLTPRQQKDGIKHGDQGNDTLTEITRSYSVSHSIISRIAS